MIPASFSDQLAAQRLAMCNDIGEASYIDSFIAASLLQVLRELPSFPAIDERLKLRFKVPLDALDDRYAASFPTAVEEPLGPGRLQICCSLHAGRCRSLL